MSQDQPGRKRLTDEQGLRFFPPKPYYEPPGVGVAPSMVAPASGFNYPGHPAVYGDPGNYVPPQQANYYMDNPQPGYYQGGTDDVAAYEAQQLAAHQEALASLDDLRGANANDMQRRAAMQTIEMLNDGKHDWFGTGSPGRDRYFMQGRKSAYSIGDNREYQPYGLTVVPRFQGGTSDVPLPATYQPAGSITSNDPIGNPFGQPGALSGNDPIGQPFGMQPRDDFYAGKFFGGGLQPHGHGMFGDGQSMGFDAVGGGRGGGGRMNMRMFQGGTEDVLQNPLNPWEPYVPPLSLAPQSVPSPLPPAPATTPATTAATPTWTPEQQAVVDRIYSGREDKRFGPGVPNPTREDRQTYVGSPRYAPASGFQQERGVALAPKEYDLFTPEQRRFLGIMDKGPASNEGLIERWYGTPGAWAGTGDSQYANPHQGSFGKIENGVYSMDPSSDYAKTTAGTDTSGPSKFGEGVGTFGKAISGLGAGFSKAADEDTKRATSQALALVSGPSNPYAQADPLADYYRALSGSTGFTRG